MRKKQQFETRNLKKAARTRILIPLVIALINMQPVTAQTSKCDITGELIICDGQSTTLCGLPGMLSYAWSSGETTECISVSSGGVYTVTVEETTGAFYSCEATVVQSPAISVKCDADEHSGLVSVNASGGTDPLVYLWDNGETASSFYAEEPGEYCVVVTDALGCQASCCVAIKEPCVPGRTQTQGGWGAKPSGNNPAMYLKNNFAGAFPAPGYLTIGCNNTLKLTSANAVKDFLPSGSTPSLLPAGHMVNPGGAYNNVFAGQLVALTINLAMDQYDPAFSSSPFLLKDYVIVSGLFAGLTVEEIWIQANRRIGGCTSPYGKDNLHKAVSRINENFNGGNTDNGYLRCPGEGKKRILAPFTVDDAAELASRAYPNPFATSTTLEFIVSGKQSRLATVDVFDLNGRKISTVFEDLIMPGTVNIIEVDGSRWMPGLYTYRIVSGASVSVGKLMLMQR